MGECARVLVCRPPALLPRWALLLVWACLPPLLPPPQPRRPLRLPPRLARLTLRRPPPLRLNRLRLSRLRSPPRCLRLSPPIPRTPMFRVKNLPLPLLSPNL